MPYIVLMAGTMGLVLIWVTYVELRSRLTRELRDSGDNAWVRHKVKDRLTGRLMGSVAGSLVIGWAMWGWGVQAIQAQLEQQEREQIWFATFTSEHQLKWVEDCEALFAAFGSDVVYDADAGSQISLQQCLSEWRPPVVPREYTTDAYSQPRSVYPRVSRFIFGENLTRYVCVSQDDCYSWDDFVSPPVPDVGMDPPSGF